MLKSKIDIDLATSKFHKGRIEIRISSGECFHNCMHNQGYIEGSLYVEGWITDSGEKMEHAWLEINGKIIEVTLDIENDPDYDSITYEAVHSLTLSQLLQTLKEDKQDISEMFSKVIAPVKKSWASSK